jgi:glyoxylase-like metal-dependent hydrolase (beta-lactamase superfamily II)
LRAGKEKNPMSSQYDEVRNGIVLFKGKISRNLMVEPITSNTYILEDGDEITIFDPSSGKNIAKRIEAYIRSRLNTKVEWKRAFLIAGHSHLDHANNFYLSDVIGAPDTHIYVHEKGFQNGRVMNEPAPFIENMMGESRKYYNFYLAYPFPYNLFMIPFAIADRLSPSLALKAFSLAGAVPWPDPQNGSHAPEALKDSDMQMIDIGDMEIQGWRIGNKIILPTPGHSPCSVTLFWPEKKALFISDAAWIGNPVFMNSSLQGIISSLEKIKELTKAGKVELLHPAHGHVIEGPSQILNHIDFHILGVEVMRNEILATYKACGKEKDVRKLTKVLTQESPLFRLLKLTNYPRMVVIVHNIVAACLRDEGILNVYVQQYGK